MTDKLGQSPEMEKDIVTQFQDIIEMMQTTLDMHNKALKALAHGVKTNAESIEILNGRVPEEDDGK